MDKSLIIRTFIYYILILFYNEKKNTLKHIQTPKERKIAKKNLKKGNSKISKPQKS